MARGSQQPQKADNIERACREHDCRADFTRQMACRSTVTGVALLYHSSVNYQSPVKTHIRLCAAHGLFIKPNDSRVAVIMRSAILLAGPT